MKCYNVEISAENQRQAGKILERLLEKRLVTGGQFIQAPARFWWKNKIIDMDYITITSFTLSENKQQIIEIVESLSEEEVPMIRFTEFEANEKLYQWINELVGERHV